MKKKEEKKQINKKWKGLKARIQSFLASADQNELHQFRVQVKKLKALLVMLQSDKKNHKLLKDFKPVKQIFREAGDIRNAYVNLQLSEQYHLQSPDFAKHQQQIMEQGTIAFKTNSFKHIKKLKRTHTRINHDIHQLDNKSIRQFYQDNLFDIEAFLQNIVFDEQLHDCRKKVKLLMYNQKLAGKVLPRKLRLNTDYLNQLQDSIGQWHDNALAMDLFKPDENRNKAVLNKLRKNGRKLRQEIIDLSENFKAKVTAPVVKETKHKDKAQTDHEKQ
ncbi:CHAD domain-containing protein [Mucilaginibacter sp. Bleaf8]|uniref:CHAD domain-containing protein n=1 Tax=Mucilaginibacter sp. Bleaf8 TaxID=2834430 RepID=UPI001BCFA004|nr:CHAD domain-containing protein [Mucilaginibacter sp. Bleaf8]MBS7564410.1 CHAD domain-containing protein [Mucilaginibacter sp. Bleaf8]